MSNMNRKKRKKQFGLFLCVLLAALLLFPPQISQGASAEAGGLVIDDSHVYAGMEQSWSSGYVPVSRNGTVSLVLPLLAENGEEPASVRASLVFDDSGSSPFVRRNYQKTVKKEVHQTRSGETMEAYLISFDIDLEEERMNGVYSVTVRIRYWVGLRLVSQEFPVYVRITDGKSGEVSNPDDSSVPDSETQDSAQEQGGSQIADTAPMDDMAPAVADDTAVYADGGAAPGGGEEQPTSEPKVILSACEGLDEAVHSGETVNVTAKLKNTSAQKYVQNMTVAVTVQEPGITLEADSNVFYIDRVAAGGTADLPLTFSVTEQTLAGKYPVLLEISYDNPDAVALTSSMQFHLTVAQNVDVGFEVGEYSRELNAGDSVSIPIQAMNLGRDMIYNVRCEIKVPGLEAKTSLFLGNLDGGTAGSGEMTVFAGIVRPEAESEAERYGSTSGTLELIYEDAAGNEYRQSENVSVNISPLTIGDGSNVETEPEVLVGRQFVAGVLVGWAVVAVLIFVPRYLKRRKEQQDDSSL